MIKRLTERDEYGNADIIGVDSAELQLNLEFDELNRVTDVFNRLAAYEDTGLTPKQIEAQQQEITNYLKVIEQQRDTLARDSDSFNKQQQEIDRLKAQATVKDTQLRIILENINKFPPEGTTIGKNIWIESTKAALTSDSFYHNPADTELIDALVSDKDEQAGRIKQLEELLKACNQAFCWILHEADFEDEYERTRILNGFQATRLAVYALLGGKNNEN